MGTRRRESADVTNISNVSVMTPRPQVVTAVRCFDRLELNHDAEPASMSMDGTLHGHSIILLRDCAHSMLLSRRETPYKAPETSTRRTVKSSVSTNKSAAMLENDALQVRQRFQRAAAPAPEGLHLGSAVKLLANQPARYRIGLRSYSGVIRWDRQNPRSLNVFTGRIPRSVKHRICICTRAAKH